MPDGQKIKLGNRGGYDEDGGGEGGGYGSVGIEGGGDFQSVNTDVKHISKYLTETDPTAAVNLYKQEKGFSASPEESANISINKKVDDLRNKIKTSIMRLSGQKDTVKALANEMGHYKGFEEEAERYIDIVESITGFKSDVVDTSGKYAFLALIMLGLANFGINIYWSAKLIQSDKPYSSFKESYDASVVSSCFSMAFVIICAFFYARGDCSLLKASMIGGTFSTMVILCTAIAYTKLPTDIDIPDIKWYFIVTGLSSIFGLGLVLFYIFSVKVFNTKTGIL